VNETRGRGNDNADEAESGSRDRFRDDADHHSGK
jgi:hypothetical protein